MVQDFVHQPLRLGHFAGCGAKVAAAGAGEGKYGTCCIQQSGVYFFAIIPLAKIDYLGTKYYIMRPWCLNIGSNIIYSDSKWSNFIIQFESLWIVDNIAVGAAVANKTTGHYLLIY